MVTFNFITEALVEQARLKGLQDRAYEEARYGKRRHRLLEMDIDGNILYKRDIKIPLGPPATQHALLMKFAINNPSPTWQISFNDLNSYFQANGLKLLHTDTAIRQRFKNAIGQVIRIYKLDEINPDGKPLFEAVRGLGYKFNNMLID